MDRKEFLANFMPSGGVALETNEVKSESNYNSELIQESLTSARVSIGQPENVLEQNHSDDNILQDEEYDYELASWSEQLEYEETLFTDDFKKPLSYNKPASSKESTKTEFRARKIVEQIRQDSSRPVIEIQLNDFLKEKLAETVYRAKMLPNKFNKWIAETHYQSVLNDPHVKIVRDAIDEKERRRKERIARIVAEAKAVGRKKAELAVRVRHRLS